MFPVAPANAGVALSWVNRVLVAVSTTSTALFVRSARKYSPITGSTKLMSNAVMFCGLGSVIWAVGANTSSGAFCAIAGLPTSSRPGIVAKAQQPKFLGASGRSPAKTLSMIRRRARVHGRRLAWRFGWQRSGCESADHPKLPARPRKSLVFARLFGSGFAGLGVLAICVRPTGGSRVRPELHRVPADRDARELRPGGRQGTDRQGNHSTAGTITRSFE